MSTLSTPACALGLALTLLAGSPPLAAQADEEPAPATATTSDQHSRPTSPMRTPSSARSWTAWTTPTAATPARG